MCQLGCGAQEPGDPRPEDAGVVEVTGVGEGDEGEAEERPLGTPRFRKQVAEEPSAQET